MITDNHRKIANLAAYALKLGADRRARLLRALAKTFPHLTITAVTGKIDRAKLRRLRKTRKWTQEKMAHKCGLGLRQYINIEKGHTNTTRARTLKIAEALGVGVLEIV